MALIRVFAEAMSEVISFRINPINSCDVLALAVLKQQIRLGYNTCHTIKESLLKLDSYTQGEIELEIMKNMLIQLNEIIESIRPSSNMINRNVISRKYALLHAYSVNISNRKARFGNQSIRIA